MLSGLDISKLVEAGRRGDPAGIGVAPLAPSLAQKQISPASIDLRLGRWFHVLHQSKLPQIDLSTSDSGNLELSGGKYSYVPFGQKFVVHPGRFVLAATLEWIRLPRNIGGYITGKSSLGRRGLVIETAFGIQPLFSGCLALEIYNCGEVPIAITPGMRICQVFFHELNGDTQELPGARFKGRRKPIFGPYEVDFRVSKAGQLDL